MLIGLAFVPRPVSAQEGEPEMLEDPVVHGAWLYEGHCVRCHGAYGDQRTGAGASREELTERIAGGERGRDGGCQIDWALTEGGPLSTADIRDLVRYIQAWEELGASPDLPELPPQPTLTPRPTPTPEPIDAGKPAPTPAPTPDPLLEMIAPILAQNSVAEGAWLVHANCAKCHGAYTMGRMGQSVTLDQLREAVVNGKSGTNMPAFALTKGGSLRSRQIDDIVAYVGAWESLGESPALPDALVEAMLASGFEQASLQPVALLDVPAVTGDPAAGLALYRPHCSPCHGLHGEGRIGAPLTRTWLSVRPDLTIRSTIAQGITGTLMPAWSRQNGGPLTDAEIDDVVALVLNWSGSKVADNPHMSALDSLAVAPSPWRGGLGVAVLLVSLGALVAGVIVRTSG